MSTFKQKYKGDIVLGTSVMVSDPCYSIGTWCQGVVGNVVPGTYKCYVEHCQDSFWGDRVSAIEVVHADYNHSELDYVETNFEVGVDSGQAGIFNYNYYKKYHEDDNGHKRLNDDWYDKVCGLTSTKDGFAGNTIDNNGLASSSGYGDGIYWCYISHDQNENVIAIRVDFIYEDDEEDESV